MDRHDRSSVLHSGMDMGRRRARARTPALWIAAHELPATGGHPFYQRLNHVLGTHSFDEFVEARCVVFYATTTAGPVFTPHHRFELLPVGASE